MRLVGPHCIVSVSRVLELGNVAFSGATRPEMGPRGTLLEVLPGKRPMLGEG